MTALRRLEVGDVGMFDGTPHRVERVTNCSATLVAQFSQPREITLNAGQDNERTFLARTGKSVQVSPCAVLDPIPVESAR